MEFSQQQPAIEEGTHCIGQKRSLILIRPSQGVSLPLFKYVRGAATSKGEGDTFWAANNVSLSPLLVAAGYQ